MVSIIPNSLMKAVRNKYIRYRYTSFFWSRSEVAIFFKTSGNRAETSFPSVIDMMVF